MKTFCIQVLCLVVASTCASAADFCLERKVAIVGAPVWQGEVLGIWQCKKNCTKDSNCAAFTYDKNTQVCSLYEDDDSEVQTVLPPVSGFKEGKSLRCSAQPTTVPAAPSTEGFIPTTEDDTDYCDGWGTRYTGPVISTLTDLHLNGQNGREECDKRCKDHGDCAAYAYRWMSCALLKGVDMVEAVDGSYSARKGCVTRQ